MLFYWDFFIVSFVCLHVYTEVTLKYKEDRENNVLTTHVVSYVHCGDEGSADSNLWAKSGR